MPSLEHADDSLRGIRQLHFVIGFRPRNHPGINAMSVKEIVHPVRDGFAFIAAIAGHHPDIEVPIFLVEPFWAEGAHGDLDMDVIVQCDLIQSGCNLGPDIIG